MIVPLKCSASSVFSSPLPSEDKTKKPIELAINIFCNYCKKENAQAKLCLRCKQIYYCNKTCQTQDWPVHKNLCKAPIPIPVPIETRHETTFASEKLILNLKQIGEHILPVYSKKNLSSGLNFSKIANVFAYVMTDQMERAKTLIEKKLKENPQIYGLEIHIPNTTFINNISYQFSEFQNIIRSDPEKKYQIQNLEVAEKLFKEFLEGEPFIKLHTIPKNRDELLKEFKIRSELFVYTNTQDIGNHIVKHFEISEAAIEPFGGKELIAKINPNNFSCDKFAFLMLQEIRAKDWIFDSAQPSLIYQMLDLLRLWNYQPVELPKKGDLILYMDKLKPIHLGVYIGQDRVLSKHGYANPFIVESEIFDVSAAYGEEVIFFSRDK